MADDATEALFCKGVPVYRVADRLIQKQALVAEIVTFSTFRENENCAFRGRQREFIIQGSWLRTSSESSTSVRSHDVSHGETTHLS